jgi:predicted RNA polymerase sigma factor
VRVDVTTDPGGASDPSSFRVRRLVASIFLLSGDLDLSRDVVDETCTRALERWNRVAHMESPDGWADVVAVHELQRRRINASCV